MELPYREAGTRLYLVRRNRGVSVADLARGLGCTPSLIYSWECGRDMPNATQLMALAKALSAHVEELLGKAAAV